MPCDTIAVNHVTWLIVSRSEVRHIPCPDDVRAPIAKKFAPLHVKGTPFMEVHRYDAIAVLQNAPLCFRTTFYETFVHESGQDGILFSETGTPVQHKRTHEHVPPSLHDIFTMRRAIGRIPRDACSIRLKDVIHIPFECVYGREVSFIAFRVERIERYDVSREEYRGEKWGGAQPFDILTLRPLNYEQVWMRVFRLKHDDGEDTLWRDYEFAWAFDAEVLHDIDETESTLSSII